MIAIEELKQLLAYEPDTGALRWKVAESRRVNVGDIAGHVEPRGYVWISVRGHKIVAHRVAWAYVHGAWPSGEVDHINGDKGDNRISNLRDVSKSENMRNRKGAKQNNRLGILGVHFETRRNRFVAQIQADDKRRVYLGSYKTAEEASAAYCAARELYHPGAPQ